MYFDKVHAYEKPIKTQRLNITVRIAICLRYVRTAFHIAHNNYHNI